MFAPTPTTSGRYEETLAVYSDDSSPDDKVQSGAITGDRETDIDAADAESEAVNDDAPGFTDWREELRERLKRIRARREEEQLTLGEKADEFEAGQDVDALKAEGPEASEDNGAIELNAVDEMDEKQVGRETDPVAADNVDASEDSGVAADEPANTAADFIALLVDGPADPASDVDTEDVDAVGTQLDKLEEGPSADDAAERDDLLAAPELVTGIEDPVAVEEAVETVETSQEDDSSFDWDEAAPGDLKPSAEPNRDSAPGISTDTSIGRRDATFDEPMDTEEDWEGELEFDEATRVTQTTVPELDLLVADPENNQELEWDEEILEPAAKYSSAGPLGERAAAALCDLLVLTAIGSLLVGTASSGTGVPFRQILVEEILGLGLTWAIFTIGYSVFFVGSCGQTIGRMVMRLRVVGNDQFSVGFSRAAFRLSAWVISALPMLAGMLPALRDPERRGLHDRLSRTRVVKA